MYSPSHSTFCGFSSIKWLIWYQVIVLGKLSYCGFNRPLGLFCFSIRLLVCPTVFLSCPSFRLSDILPVSLSWPSLDQSVYQCARPSVHLTVRLHLCPSLCLSVLLFACPSVSLSVCPSSRLSVRLPVRRSVRPAVIRPFWPSVRLWLSVYLPVRLPVCLLFRLSVYLSNWNYSFSMNFRICL